MCPTLDAPKNMNATSPTGGSEGDQSMARTAVYAPLAASLTLPSVGCMPKRPVPLYVMPVDLVSVLPGMTFKEVQDVMGIGPYDLLMSHGDDHWQLHRRLGRA